MSKLIEERKKQRKQENIKKKTNYNQFILAIILILVMVSISFLLFRDKYIYSISLILGTVIGFVLRSSRFCFVSAFRDPFLIGSTKILRAIILALIVSTIGFAIIQFNYIESNGINYNNIPGAIGSVGLHIAIGAFIFGIGMVIAGGCASGVLMRIGEGHTIHLVVLLGFIIGTLLGAKDYPFWDKHIMGIKKVIYFPKYLDFKLVVIIQIVLLVALYLLALWYEKKKSKFI